MRLLAIILWNFCYNLLLGALEAKAQRNELNCVNDYVRTISCVLNMTDGRTEDHSYWLEIKAIEFEDKLDCNLTKTRDYYSCMNYSSTDFIDDDKFEVILYSERNGLKNSTLMDSEYIPQYHIKPKRPGNLTVHLKSGLYQFAWDDAYSEIDTLYNDLNYRFAFYKNGLHSLNIEIHRVMNNTHEFEDGFFQPDSEYMAKICSLPKLPKKGQCSDWSNTVKWRTSSLHAIHKYVLLAFLVCGAAVVVLFSFFSTMARLRIKACSLIPTPAPYFQPLYNKYKGNFQNWLVYPVNLGEPLRVDEDLKIDTLIEAKPINNEESFPASTFRMDQCQIPYVSSHEKEWHIQDPCEHPRTPLTLSIVKVSFEEAYGSQSIIPAGPEEDDLGCEDQTLHHSGPSHKPQNIGYMNDYCTLISTAEGLVPTTKFTTTVKSGNCRESSYQILNQLIQENAFKLPQIMQGTQ